MIRYWKCLGFALAASLGLSLTPTGANAACPLAGIWYFYDMQGISPGIVTNMKSVVVGPALNNKANIESFTFSNSNTGYKNDTSRAIMCTMTVKANGTFTAPCVSYGVTGNVQSVNVSGTLALSATCDLTGTITIPSDTAVTIRGGHVNGTMGSGIATQGTNVHHFTVVRK